MSQFKKVPIILHVMIMHKDSIVVLLGSNKYKESLEENWEILEQKEGKQEKQEEKEWLRK